MPLLATRSSVSRRPVDIVVWEGRTAVHDRPGPRPVGDLLLNTLPAARRVLAIGCGGIEDGGLQAAYRGRHADVQWRCADSLDDLDHRKVPFDLIVLGEGVSDRLLGALGRLAAPGASLVVQLRNSATLGALERVIEGDLTDGDESAVGDARAYSPAAVYKLLMDAGWMPTLAGRRDAPAGLPGMSAAALAMADTLDIPRGTAQRTLSMDEFVIHAQRVFADAQPLPAADPTACFTVVVPTTRERQLTLNTLRSPGLREVAARIVSCRHAAHAAEALEQALPHCDADWVLLCHQDVYFPSGFGERLNALLAGVPPAQRSRTLIGFVGVGVNATTQTYEPSGFVIDRLHAADHPASDRAVSIDELAIVIARDSIHRIDPALGWHLWATDLCLTAICQHQMFARIVRLPLFHNSVTDYVLPSAFVDAAAVLADKHAAFGPIATLCGTIDAAFFQTHGRPVCVAARAVVVPVATPLPASPACAEPTTTAASAPASRDLLLPSAARNIDAQIDAGKFDAATETIYRSIHLSYTQDGIKHRLLYTPEFDRQLLRLAQALGAEPGRKRNGLPGVPLLVATELYDLGGHSRVLEEVSREMQQPVLVLTDLFRTYHRDPAQLTRIRERFAHTQVMVLPDVPLWEKCRMLRTLDLHLVPRSTLYFGHHQDPIPFIGTLAQPGRRRLFIHHGDHNPSLGCTLPGVQHVDLIGNLQAMCSERRGTAALRLPLYIADQGAKRFAPVRGCDYSVVTSGHPAKFTRAGALALQDIVAAALSTVQGRFFHIGPLPEDWVAEIRAHVAARGIDASRFVPLGLVSSVWGTLKDIDAAVYIGSAPVSGGRAAIEAQGCGLPVLCFKGFAEGSLLADYSSYADPAMGWADAPQLAALLAGIGDRHGERSRQARAFYEAEFSRTTFRKVLHKLLGS